MASTQLVGDMLLQISKHLLLDRHVFEDRLNDEVAVREVGQVGSSGDQRAKPIRFIWDDPPLFQQSVDLCRHIFHSRVDSHLVEIGDHDRHLEATQEQDGELARHQPSANDANLGDRSSQRGIRRTGRLPRTLLDKIERVEARAQLGTHDQISECFVLGGVRLDPV